MRNISYAPLAVLLLVLATVTCSPSALADDEEGSSDVIDYTGEDEEDEVWNEENIKNVAKGLFYIVLAVVLYMVFQMPLFLALSVTGLISLINVFFDVFFAVI